jgi:hypothetical protein
MSKSVIAVGYAPGLLQLQGVTTEISRDSVFLNESRADSARLTIKSLQSFGELSNTPLRRSIQLNHEEDFILARKYQTPIT